VARRRGSKAGIVLLVMLIVLVGVLFVADRIAANVAEDQIAQQAKKELAAREITETGDPKVSIAGFPFLTQVLDGKYKKITITFNRPKVNNVQLNDLKLVASTVRADAHAVLNGTGDVVADQVSGTATMTWEAVKPLLQLAGLPKGVDPAQADLKIVNNQATLTIPMSYSGFNFHLTAKGNLAVESGVVRVKLTEVTSDLGQTPPVVQSLIKQYQNQLTATIKIPAFPYKLVVNKVETSDAGLLAVATASNVKLAGG